jgi:signal transduction histidine kinase
MNESMNILIIDDNADNLKVVSNFLKSEGYNIALSLNGENALKILETNRFDLILLDVMMPGMDGYEVCQKIKENIKTKEIPIIFLTARVEIDDIVKGFQLGGVDYITKPFNRDELLVRVKTHLDLSLSKQQLLETIKTRDKLYSIIAHDIRSPLSSIKVLISAIAHGAIKTDTDDFKTLMNDLESATNQTNTLLSNLLEWTRLQIGKVNINPQNLLIKPIIDDCISLFATQAKGKNIVVESVVNPDISAYIDEVTMHTVFRNLLSNALKFTPNNGNIRIMSGESADFVSIIFKDSGVGMSQDVIKKIIDTNQHYSSKGTNNEHGTGLGLYLVKDLIAQNNGTLLIESEVGEGSIFTICVPKSIQ